MIVREGERNEWQRKVRCKERKRKEWKHKSEREEKEKEIGKADNKVIRKNVKKKRKNCFYQIILMPLRNKCDDKELYKLFITRGVYI